LQLVGESQQLGIDRKQNALPAGQLRTQIIGQIELGKDPLEPPVRRQGQPTQPGQTLATHGESDPLPRQGLPLAAEGDGHPSNSKISKNGKVKAVKETPVVVAAKPAKTAPAKAPKPAVVQARVPAKISPAAKGPKAPKPTKSAPKPARAAVAKPAPKAKPAKAAKPRKK